MILHSKAIVLLASLYGAHIVLFFTYPSGGIKDLIKGLTNYTVRMTSGGCYVD